MAVQEQKQKPSTMSMESDSTCKDDVKKGDAGAGNWSCNAGDSSADITPVVKDQRSFKGGTPPQNQPRDSIHDCEFEFKVLPPTGSYVGPFVFRL